MLKSAKLVSCPGSSTNKLITPSCHTGGSRYLDAFEIPGFRVALAIASLPGMTIDLCCEFLSQDTSIALLILSDY